MAEVVKIDKSGRMVIPKALREELGMEHEDQLLITMREGSRLIIQKIDVDSLVEEIKREINEKTVDDIVKKVREETNARIKELYPDLFD